MRVWTVTTLPPLWNYFYGEFKLIYHTHILPVHNILNVTKRERTTTDPKKMLVQRIRRRHEPQPTGNGRRSREENFDVSVL
jgi:hypothetical protein